MAASRERKIARCVVVEKEPEVDPASWSLGAEDAGSSVRSEKVAAPSLLLSRAVRRRRIWACHGRRPTCSVDLPPSCRPVREEGERVGAAARSQMFEGGRQGGG